MKKYIRFFVCGWCWLLVCVLAENAAVAMAPDAGIRADLESIFSNPPQVQGYPFQPVMEAAADRYGLPLPLVLAVARGESFFDPSAKSAKGAIGIMQVLPSTAADYGVTEKDLLDPEKNIDVGVHYLADLYAQIQDPYLTLAAYYCGCSGVDKENLTLRKDCDEYVRYINTHLRTILARAEAGVPASQVEENHFVLARFDNFLDAENFLEFLAGKLPDLSFDTYRREVAHTDHVRYQYQILVTYGTEKERTEICRAVEESTGFAFCRF